MSPDATHITAKQEFCLVVIVTVTFDAVLVENGLDVF